MSSNWMTDAELVQLRADIEGLQPDTCTIQRSTPVNSGGNWAESWSAVETATCRVEPFTMLDAGKDVTGDLSRETILSSYRVYLPWDADIQEGDRIVYNAQVFNMVQLSDAHTDRGCRTLVVTRIQGDESA